VTWEPSRSSKVSVESTDRSTPVKPLEFNHRQMCEIRNFQ
jgi:hypothetical protein